MPLIGPFTNVPTGATWILQSTGVKGDIVLAPFNFNASGVSTGASLSTSSLQRFFLTMGG